MPTRKPAFYQNFEQQPIEVPKPLAPVIHNTNMAKITGKVVKDMSPQLRRPNIGQGRLDIELRTVRNCMCISHEVLPPSNFVGRQTYYNASPRKPT